MEPTDGIIKHMNRLIIIGNGFDLAHGFKSSYSAFMTDYICNALNTFYKQNYYFDKLLEIRFRSSPGGFSSTPTDATIDNALETFESMRNRNDDFKIDFHSQVLEIAYLQVNQFKWVDLEIIFFRALYTESKRDGLDGTKKVNAELEYIKKLLIEYLKDQQRVFFQPANLDLVNYFTDPIYKDEIVTAKLVSDLEPENLHFLNFNYTNILDYYTEKCNKRVDDVSVNHIHGTLDGYDGEPIFGFGDEYDKKYLEFENDVKYFELVKHIKSFEYTKTKNYYDLIRFIDSGNFQVHIYGHSCGISDRTMLSQIFEHENCLSIKVFYYQKNVNENDYAEKSFEIARHFKDKKLFRKKLIPKDLSKPLPKIYN